MDILQKKDQKITNIVNALFCALLLALFVIFPADNTFQLTVKFFIFLFLAPWLYVKFILKKDLKWLGLQWGDKKTGILWAIISLILLLALSYAINEYTGFGKKYFLPTSAIRNFGYFLAYEFLLVNFFLFLYEFFFRGFLQKITDEYLGRLSMLIQAAVFLLVLLLSQVTLALYLPLILISLTNGIIRRRTDSILYGYFSGLLFVILFDFLYIYLNRI